MKLKKYEDKNEKKRKVILISLGVIVLISVSLLLYKTFASFTESTEFQVMKGKVDYFGNSDVYFAFYKGDEELEEMPQKDNKEKLVFDYGTCDNGASIKWDNEAWGPMVKDLSTNKTKCSLYFKEQTEIVLGKDIKPVDDGDGLYAVPHNDLEELGQEWNKEEYRYAGIDPDNYVKFNNEIWRIIGLVNVKTESGNIEQRIKIIRQDGIENQKDFGKYVWDNNNSNNWVTSTLKDMLNGIYYESQKGDCYHNYSVSPNECNFSENEGLPKGLDQQARDMIDNELIWNLGGWNTSQITANIIYEKERGTNTGNSNDYPSEWSKANDTNSHKGVALMYPSDYGYAVGGNGRKSCLSNSVYYYNENDCKINNWLDKSVNQWSLMPGLYTNNVFNIFSNGNIGNYSYVTTSYVVWPVVYLKFSTKIVDGTGDINSPFILSVQ